MGFCGATQMHGSVPGGLIRVIGISLARRTFGATAATAASADTLAPRTSLMPPACARRDTAPSTASHYSATAIGTLPTDARPLSPPCGTVAPAARIALPQVTTRSPLASGESARVSASRVTPSATRIAWT